MSKSSLFFVEIVEDVTETVVKRMGPFSLKRAERIERGAGINLNWEAFYTRIIEQIPLLPGEGK